MPFEFVKFNLLWQYYFAYQIVECITYRMISRVLVVSTFCPRLFLSIAKSAISEIIFFPHHPYLRAFGFHASSHFFYISGNTTLCIICQKDSVINIQETFAWETNAVNTMLQVEVLLIHFSYSISDNKDFLSIFYMNISGPLEHEKNH